MKSEDEEKYMCEICGSQEDVKYRCGAVTFLCKNCEKIIARWNYVQAKFQLNWSGVQDSDLLEMKEYAEYNHKIKDDIIDNSMSVLLEQEEESE